MQNTPFFMQTAPSLSEEEEIDNRNPSNRQCDFGRKENGRADSYMLLAVNCSQICSSQSTQEL
jgi:hypothetical protein